MAEDKPSPEQSSAPVEPAVTRWLAEQKEWQRTLLTYVDSMTKNDEFLVHLGNAMRGSLLAGKPYPTQGPASAAAPQSEADDRLDQVLFALHKIEGEIADLKLSMDELRESKKKHKDKSGKRKGDK